MLMNVPLMMPGGLIARPSVTILAGMEVSKETLLLLPLAIRLPIQQDPKELTFPRGLRLVEGRG